MAFRFHRWVNRRGDIFTLTADGVFWLQLLGIGPLIWLGRLAKENGRLVYIKPVVPEKTYFFRKLKSWGVTKTLADALAKKDALVRYVGRTWIYECPAVVVVARIAKSFGGYEKQYFVPKGTWHARRKL